MYVVWYCASVPLTTGGVQRAGAAVGMCAASSHRPGHSVWVGDARQRSSESVQSYRQLAADSHVAECSPAPLLTGNFLDPF